MRKAMAIFSRRGRRRVQISLMGRRARVRSAAVKRAVVI